MNIAGYINDLTQLRYFLPLFETIHNVFPEVQITTYYDRTNKKYNGFAIKENWRLFDFFIKERPFIKMVEAKMKQKCEILFSMECVGLDRFQCEHHFAIQHGADYQSPTRKSPTKTTYILSAADYKADLYARHQREALVPPVPITFWRAGEIVRAAERHLASLGHKGEPIATIFYPDKGHESIASKIISYLEAKGYFVVVKQRRKCQPLPGSIKHRIYDDAWYPSESIYFPAVSSVCIGFGSTSFSDIVPLGLRYIDLRLPHPQYGLVEYVPISSPSYSYLEEGNEDQVFSMLDALAPDKLKLLGLVEKAEEFVRSELFAQVTKSLPC